MPCKRTSYFIWEFLLAILQEDECSSTISWTNESALEFEIKDMNELAKLWGVLRGNPEMEKESFFRALRYYYKINVITKIKNRRRLFKFNHLPRACSSNSNPGFPLTSVQVSITSRRHSHYTR